MDNNLFEGLPPPATTTTTTIEDATSKNNKEQESTTNPVVVAPKPALKSALKRPKPPQETNPDPQDTAPERTTGCEKRLRFKTTTDVSDTQVTEAMQKIASHMNNPAKFSKASKLAIQLMQAGNVKPGTSDHFFAILEAAMLSSTSCNDAPLRADYRALFLAAQDIADCLNVKQKHLLATWTIRAVVANDLFTDDSFVFSKTAGRIKESIANLPIVTEDDDIEEATALKAKEDSDGVDIKDNSEAPTEEADKKDESDPFGLDALIPSSGKKDERAKVKKSASAELNKREEVEEEKRFIKSQREALIVCLEIAARRYRIPWCQTVIDILVKHAYDNVSRFTSHQRDAISKLWASIREQQTRRKQGKSVNGKLDVTAFEWLQEKYSTEKISIRHSVGGSGDRRAQQWLG